MKNLVFIILTLFLILFNIVLFAEEKPKEWSEYQGKLSWKGASIKCESIGMRLPTIQELKSPHFPLNRVPFFAIKQY